MLNQLAVDAYIQSLPYNEAYTSLTSEMQGKVAFGAWEMLRRRYGTAVITDEMTALQAIYIAEGEGEEFAKFKRHAVKSIGLDGMSLSFDMIHISPEVVALIENAEVTATEDGPIFGSYF